MKIKAASARNYSSHSLRRASTSGKRVAGLRGGEAAARCGSFSEPQIQNSRFKIKGDCQAYLGLCSDSGRSLRRARLRRQGAADLRAGEAAAHSVLTDRFPLKANPQPSGWACDIEEQPSAGGRQRAVERKTIALTDGSSKTGELQAIAQVSARRKAGPPRSSPFLNTTCKSPPSKKTLHPLSFERKGVRLQRASALRRITVASLYSRIAS